MQKFGQVFYQKAHYAHNQQNKTAWCVNYINNVCLNLTHNNTLRQ